MTEERKHASRIITKPEDSLSLPSRTRVWDDDNDNNDAVRENKSSSTNSSPKWKSKWNWASTHRCASSNWIAYQNLQIQLTTIFNNVYEKVKPYIPKIHNGKKQFYAFLLFGSCGITPFVVFGHLTRGQSPRMHRDDVPFVQVWWDKTLSCGGDFAGRPQNSTIKGIEKLFVLDSTYGEMSFSQVKTIDVVWDVLVGRGVQLLAWWVAYIVFSDALLRVIERHPASFRIFQRIASEGPSLLSVWTLMKEVWAAKSKRTRALFSYIFLSTVYVLWIPLLLSAMTGYDSSTISWVSLDDDNNKIVPSSSLKFSWIIFSAKNETFDHAICKSSAEQMYLQESDFSQNRSCNCQLSNGTMFIPDRNTYRPPSNCTYKYPGNIQTYRRDYYNMSSEIVPCTTSMNITINGKTYEGSELNSTYGYCYNSVGYSGQDLARNSRCLPDTTNPTYQWGFSTILSALFIIFHMAWSTTMYVVWQDAQFNSSLVKGGYAMTPVLAAFAMAKAAKRKTGLDEKELLRANTKELDQELYGDRKTKGTKVEYSFFVHDPEQDGNEDEGGLRRRRVRSKDEPGLSEETLK